MNGQTLSSSAATVPNRVLKLPLRDDALPDPNQPTTVRWENQSVHQWLSNLAAQTLVDPPGQVDDGVHSALSVISSISSTSPGGNGPQPCQPLTSSEKADLAKYMTAWLRRNWINPYPDDAMLRDMAVCCQTTPAVVSNWLINARTRKWRPAIVKATKLNRPSDTLLEDSLCMFDGVPVRPLADTTTPGSYLIPVVDDFETTEIDRVVDDMDEKKSPVVMMMEQHFCPPSNKRRKVEEV